MWKLVSRTNNNKLWHYAVVTLVSCAIQRLYSCFYCGQFHDNGRAISYIADVLVYSQGTDREQTVRKLQDELDRISSWCVQSGALVNPTKAALSSFSLNNNIVHTLKPTVAMLGVSIERSHTMKYSGSFLTEVLF